MCAYSVSLLRSARRRSLGSPDYSTNQMRYNISTGVQQQVGYGSTFSSQPIHRRGHSNPAPGPFIPAQGYVRSSSVQPIISHNRSASVPDAQHALPSSGQDIAHLNPNYSRSQGGPLYYVTVPSHLAPRLTDGPSPPLPMLKRYSHDKTGEDFKQKHAGGGEIWYPNSISTIYPTGSNPIVASKLTASAIEQGSNHFPILSSSSSIITIPRNLALNGSLPGSVPSQSYVITTSKINFMFEIS